MGIWICSRQKLTSPKWNRFKGIRLRWKDKIRLNNVIWRCWHMQCKKKIFSIFINSLIYAFKIISEIKISPNLIVLFIKKVVYLFFPYQQNIVIIFISLFLYLFQSIIIFKFNLNLHHVYKCYQSKY